MTDDFEDLLGGTPAPRKRGRPTREEAARRASEAAAREREEAKKVEGFYASPEGRRLINAAATGRTAIDAREFHMPVSQNWLADILGLDSQTVKKRLRKVKPCGEVGASANKRFLYDFREALPYLIKPKMDTQTFINTLNAADLPGIVNKLVYDGLRSKLRYKVEAQEAWQTEDVLAIFSDVGMLIKDHTQMWVEEMRETSGFTDEQCEKLEAMIGIYRNELYKKLVELPRQKQTRAVISVDPGPQDDDLPDFEDEE